MERRYITSLRVLLFVLLFAPVALTSGLRLDAQTSSVSYGYTGLRSDGNRYIAGKGNFPRVRLVDIALPARPVWIAAARTVRGSLWVVSMEDGKTALFSVEGTNVSKVRGVTGRLPPGAPPVLVVDAGSASVLPDHAYGNNYLTYPVILPRSGKTVLIDRGGNLVVRSGNRTDSLDINVLPDARILFDENERLLVLTDPSDAYKHGILGDVNEATAVTIVDTDPEVRVAGRIPVEEGKVIEGLSPIWTDFNGDGTRDVIVTLSDGKRGAQIAVYEEEGTLAGAGHPIGRGNRWMHQLAVAPLGEAGEAELAVVRTPHIGGVVEYYTFSGPTLKIVARLEGFSTHRIGSRNLDTAVACDFDGDGTVELLLPGDRFETLYLLSKKGGRIDIESSYPVGGTAVTNIHAVCGPGNICVVGVGRADGTIRIWVPSSLR